MVEDEARCGMAVKAWHGGMTRRYQQRQAEREHVVE
jgi:hypothetical protein